MFRADPTLSFVAATRERVVAVVESINQPQISIPTKPPQAAQGYLCAVRNANGSFSVYAVLYLSESAENVVYAHEPRELATDGYIAAEAEGMHFLESMGFMLDKLEFRNMPQDQQERTLARVPAFSRRAAPREDRGGPAALARLLSSF
jgi:hypothetical protein